MAEPHVLGLDGVSIAIDDPRFSYPVITLGGTLRIPSHGSVPPWIERAPIVTHRSTGDLLDRRAVTPTVPVAPRLTGALVLDADLRRAADEANRARHRVRPVHGARRQPPPGLLRAPAS